MKSIRTQLTTYCGTHQSMGAVFSVVHGKDRVIMDFGTAFDPTKGNYIRRDDNWIREKLALGLLPEIDGLYPGRYLGDYPLKSYEQCDYNTAVFVSHLHLDHMSNIGAVAPEVKVYMSQNAIRLEKLLEEIGQGIDTVGRDYSEMHDGEIIEVGSIRVLPIMNSPYSHNMYGFMIITDDMKVGYTADLSICYEAPEMVRKEMEIFKEEKLDVLYCDVCNFSDSSLLKFFNSTYPHDIVSDRRVPEGYLSFWQHYDKLSQLYDRRDGLIVFSHYPREMLDAGLINRWAEKNGRETVWEPESGYLVWKFSDRQITFIEDERFLNEKWYEDLIRNNRTLTFNEINASSSAYCLNVSYGNIDRLNLLNSDKGLFIHADGDPFSPQEIERLKRLVAEAGFEFASYDDPFYYQHGYPSNIKYFVDYTDPKFVIGYHGSNPERILPAHGFNLVPELKIPYVMKDGKLIKEEL